MGFERSTQCILHNLYVSKLLLVSLKKNYTDIKIAKTQKNCDRIFESNKKDKVCKIDRKYLLKSF